MLFLMCGAGPLSGVSTNTVGVAFAAGERMGDHQMEMQAREAFAAGRFDEALELFAKLYAETLHPVYLRNIGRCHQKMRQPDKAIDSFRDYIAKSKKLSRDEQTEIDGYIKEMEDLKAERARAQQAAPPPPPPQGTAAAGSSGDDGAAAGTAAAGATATTTTTTAPIGTSASGTQSPDGPGSSLALGAQPPEGGVATNGATFNNDVEVHEVPETPVYKTWWFWTGVGVVVAGGVVAAVLLSGGTDRPACPTICTTANSGLINF